MKKTHHFILSLFAIIIPWQMATGFDTLVLDPDFIPLPDTTFVTNFDSDRNYHSGTRFRYNRCRQ